MWKKAPAQEQEQNGEIHSPMSPGVTNHSVVFQPKIRSSFVGDTHPRIKNLSGFALHPFSVNSPAKSHRLTFLSSNHAGQNTPSRNPFDMDSNHEFDVVVEKAGHEIGAFHSFPGHSGPNSSTIEEKPHEHTSQDQNGAPLSRTRSKMKLKICEAKEKAVYFTDERVKQSKFEQENEDEEEKFREFFETLDKNL
eukprot:TRINITY_DN5139_c0_g1_i1.p1 TRINITY_DN5139_c0_g1~~TRINITY_DN5139_c0_g1_i1.p1  ORF type:complete len:194 (-),score=22.75 TRINITY_DN5139_c0_g1_i1:102-683(-)